MEHPSINGTWDDDQAATYLGCTPDTLRIWTRRRRIPFVKVGRLTRFLKADLDEYLLRNRVPESPIVRIAEDVVELRNDNALRYFPNTKDLNHEK